MHVKTIQIDIFDTGDYVRTPRGVGIVLYTEEYIFGSQFRYEVMVKHKFGDEDNPENIAQIFDNSTPILITKKEYDEEHTW